MPEHKHMMRAEAPLWQTRVYMRCEDSNCMETSSFMVRDLIADKTTSAIIRVYDHRRDLMARS
jgi:hypothetical protein